MIYSEKIVYQNDFNNVNMSIEFIFLITRVISPLPAKPKGTIRAFSINVASPATLPRNSNVNETIGNVIELVDHIHHTPTQNDVFKICNIKKF